jgi:hypothetical protein
VDGNTQGAYKAAMPAIWRYGLRSLIDYVRVPGFWGSSFWSLLFVAFPPVAGGGWSLVDSAQCAVRRERPAKKNGGPHISAAAAAAAAAATSPIDLSTYLPGFFLLCMPCCSGFCRLSERGGSVNCKDQTVVISKTCYKKSAKIQLRREELNCIAVLDTQL